MTEGISPSLILYVYQQVASNASIIIGMHGAGLTHVFHSSIGRPNCCALIELFPRKDQGQNFEDIKGFGNIARHLGVHYWSHQNERAADGEGSAVDPEAIKGLVLQAVAAVTKRPTCLGEGIRLSLRS